MRKASIRTGRRLACLLTLATLAAGALGPGNATAAFTPDLAVDPTGNASFTWEEDVLGGSVIQARRRSAAGTLSGAQDLSAVGGEAQDPQVAVAPNGVATFVWWRSNGTDTIIQTRSRSPGGALSAVQNLSATGQDAEEPQVAVDPNGNANFVWTRFGATHNVVQARRRLANGTLEKTQTISGSDRNAVAPQVAVDPNGIATFTWLRFDGARNIVQTRRRLGNGTFEGVQNLSAAGQHAGDPQVAVDPNGRASFVWRRWNGTDDIVQTRRRLATGTLEATQDLSAAGQDAREPQVAVDPNGHATFAWVRSNGSHNIIQARRRLTNGALDATRDISAAGQNATGQQVAVASDGAASFAWLRSNGDDFIAQTRRRLAAGTFTSTQNLSAVGADANSVGVRVDQGNNATFVWARAGVIQTRRQTESLGPTVDLSN